MFNFNKGPKAASGAERAMPSQTEEGVVDALAEKIYLAAREGGDTEMTHADADMAAAAAALKAEKLGTPFTAEAVASFDENVRAMAVEAANQRSVARPQANRTLIFNEQREYVASAETPGQVVDIIAQERDAKDHPTA